VPFLPLPNPRFLAHRASARKDDDMHEVPRLIFEADAGAGDGFAVAIAQGGAVIVQLAYSDARLRTYSEQRPPTCTMPAAAAVEMACEILRQLAPDALAPASRPTLRLVGSDYPEEAA
jgi:hypothetical protein